MQADLCTSQQSNAGQANVAEAEKSKLQIEDQDLLPAFLR